jgi:hypothetical protein
MSNRIQEQEISRAMWRHRVPDSSVVEVDKVISPIAEDMISKIEEGNLDFYVKVPPNFSDIIHLIEMEQIFAAKGYTLTFDAKTRSLHLTITKNKSVLQKIDDTLLSYVHSAQNMVIAIFPLAFPLGAMVLLLKALGAL